MEGIVRQFDQWLRASVWFFVFTVDLNRKRIKYIK